MGNVLFLFMPQIVQIYPFTFSSPKFITYNFDTSFTRTNLLLFMLFLIAFILMMIVIAINRYNSGCSSLISRIKYRNINDLFSILSFPLLLFAFNF